ncbi:hypothetical protein [Alloactinosynnema sp. L-07]|nr:hypothetical protein [Alloactinosynnema sp. L-07]
MHEPGAGIFAVAVAYQAGDHGGDFLRFNPVSVCGHQFCTPR